MIHSVAGTVVPVYHSRVNEIGSESKLAQAHKNPPTQKLFHRPFNLNCYNFRNKTRQKAIFYTLKWVLPPRPDAQAMITQATQMPKAGLVADPKNVNMGIEGRKRSLCWGKIPKTTAIPTPIESNHPIHATT